MCCFSMRLFAIVPGGSGFTFLKDCGTVQDLVYGMCCFSMRSFAIVPGGSGFTYFGVERHTSICRPALTILAVTVGEQEKKRGGEEWYRLSLFVGMKYGGHWGEGLTGEKQFSHPCVVCTYIKGTQDLCCWLYRL